MSGRGGAGPGSGRLGAAGSGARERASSPSSGFPPQRSRCFRAAAMVSTSANWAQWGTPPSSSGGLRAFIMSRGSANCAQCGTPSSSWASAPRGASLGVLVVLVLPQFGPVVTASGELLVILVFPQLGPVVTAGGERRVQLSLLLVPSILIQVLSPVGLSTVRSVSRQGRLPASRFPRALAGLD